MTAVVLPHRSLGTHFRAQLLERGIPLLGIHFFSPAQLREELFRDGEMRLPLREHLRLLLSIAAEKCAREGSGTVAPAVARAPDPLLRAIDKLGSAGWNFAEESSTEMREIAARFEALVAACGFTFIHDADRAAVFASVRFNNLLIAGFDGAHWSHWPLLLAATKAARRATVVLTDPRDEARDLDATWIGSWEQAFGAAIPIDAEEAEEKEQLSLFASGPLTVTDEVHFLVGRDTTEQAEAIAALAAKFLVDGRCRRIGILFPETGALPRLVAGALQRARIAHHDTLAHFVPGPCEDRAWYAWLDLQGSQRLQPLLAFLQAHPESLTAFRGLTSDQVERILRRALDDILIDDLEVLRELCRSRTDAADAGAVANGLSAIRILPATATLAQFLHDTREIFAQLGWAERWSEVQRVSSAWSAGVDLPFTRAIYLRWLSEITSSFAPVRDEIGDHPYSRVQLLLYPQAVDQDWSHLIFCGLNEGAWPPRGAAAAFLGDEELAELNARAQGLNRRAQQQGNQGEGHTTVQQGKSLCLGSSEQREIAARHFSALVELAEVGLGVAANLFDESAPTRVANPSEFFTRLYFSARGDALSQTTFAALQEKTRDWLRPARGGDGPADSDIRQTRVAYDSRRTLAPAGEYEFALREPLSRRVTISATAWESAMSASALVWLKAYLGVEPTDDGERSALATGQWVHRWLGAISGEPSENRFAAMPAPNEFQPLIRAEAEQFREKVRSLLKSCGRTIPDWWHSGWTNAAYLADCFGGKLASVSGWQELGTEWRLHAAKVTLREHAELSFNGRADLILARGGMDAASLDRRELWVIDYKTGNKKTLRPSRCKTDEELSEKLGKKLRCGEGIQLALYALALQSAGALDVGISLLSPTLSLEEPQLRAEAIAAQTEFWRELARMRTTGIFGMRGEIRSDFSFSGDYPLATLSIEKELLEAKWALTHPAFAHRAEEADG